MAVAIDMFTQSTIKPQKSYVTSTGGTSDFWHTKNWIMVKGGATNVSGQAHFSWIKGSPTYCPRWRGSSKNLICFCSLEEIQ